MRLTSAKSLILARFVLIFLTSSLFATTSSGSKVRWTPWYNSDQPDGIGDMERLSALREIHKNIICEDPVHIEVRTRSGTHARDTGQVVHYSPLEGFWCLNEEQPALRCVDYKVRFLCPVRQLETIRLSTDGEEDQYRNSSIKFIGEGSRTRAEEWQDWTTWSHCDVTCGGTGVQGRQRNCRRYEHGDRFKSCRWREIMETRPCGAVPCLATTKSCDTSGVVTDTTNIPLEGVEIALGRTGGRSFTVLTHSDEAGRFVVGGICADSTHAHLVARKDNYVTARIHLRVNESGNAVAKVRMMHAEFPTVYEHPVSRTKLIGQSVKFCCRARGSIKEQEYSWFHNDTLVDVSLYSRDPRTLEISKLHSAHSGIYWCRVRSLVSSDRTTALSQKASLVVHSSELSACDGTPLPKLVKLPHDCTAEGNFVRTIGNGSYIDVGKCSNEICPTQSAISNGCGVDEQSITCCSPTERREISVHCGEYSMEIQKTVRCGCSDCVKPSVKVQGRAFGKNREDPLRYGFVYLGKKKVTVTSYDGAFSVNVPAGTQRLVLTFEDRFGKLMTTTKVLTFKSKGGITFHEVKMPTRGFETSFDSSSGAAVGLNTDENLESVAKLVTNPRSFYGKDGKQYSGQVRASFAFIDPRNPTSYEESPSDLTFANGDGEMVPLTTYGMFEINLRDEDQNQLSVEKAKIVLDPDQFVSPSAGKLKLWSLNPENGMWEAEDSFQETLVAYEDQEDSSPKRKKRESQTFLVGNIEIRERRLYNLDVPSENRCWMKVRAYRSPRFEPEGQVEGVEVTVINMEPDAGFRGNPQAWGRFDSALTDENGACVRVFCHTEKPDAYRAIVAAKLDSAEELYAADSSFPTDPNVVGVREDILRKLEYQRSDHKEATGKKTTFSTNLPRPETESKLKGPIYPEASYELCRNAPVTDSHFRFYRTEDFLYEYNTIYMDEHNCITWTPHYLNWWPKPLEYRACYIKVYIRSLASPTVRVKSFGGMHPETIGKLYGIRDDRSVMAVTYAGDDIIHESAACVEFKCSGMLYDMEVPDRTLVTVVPQGACTLRRINGNLAQYLTEHPPAVEGETPAEFRMYAPTDSLGHNYGIYTVTDDDPLIAKKTALGRCYAGSSDVTSRIMNQRKGVAIHYRCTGGERDEELP